MRYLRLFVIPAALVALAAGCGSGSKSVPSNAVASVGKTKVTKAEFDALLKQAERAYKAQRRPFPKAGTDEYKTLRDQAMQFLVRRAEFAQKADGLGVKVADKQVEGRLNQIKKQYFGGSQKRYEATLQVQGLTDEQVHEDIRAQLVSEALFNKVTSTVKVSDKEISDYYRQHTQQYGQPASREVRHILVKDKTTADKIYAQLKAGGDFAALAKRFSQDPGSKLQGGKLTVSRGQTVPPFDKVAFSLKAKELAKPVKTQYGWHVIQALSAVQPAKTTPLAQVKESIRQQLQQTRRNETMTKWVQDVEKEFASKVSYQAGFAPRSTATTPTSPHSTTR